MTAYIIIRSTVPEADRAAFDDWYQTRHLPDSIRLLKPLASRRGWSDTEPGIHFAILEFTDLDAARTAISSPEIKAMIADYDDTWQGRVTRTREIVGIAQHLTR